MKTLECILRIKKTNMDLVCANKVVILYKTKKFKEFLTNINTAIS